MKLVVFSIDFVQVCSGFFRGSGFRGLQGCSGLMHSMLLGHAAALLQFRQDVVCLKRSFSARYGTPMAVNFSGFSLNV